MQLRIIFRALILNFIDNLKKRKGTPSDKKHLKKYNVQINKILNIYAGIEIGESYLPTLKQIPRISELIDTFTKIFWKRLVLFAGIVSIYTVTMFWIIKPILQKNYLLKN